jgi:hypothetical protein
VNKKYLASADSENSTDDSNVNIHNDIHNKFISFVRKKKKMNSAYFRSTLTCVYTDVYKKNLVWKNINDDAEIKANIRNIKNDVSYTKVYGILNYYAKEGEKDVIGGKDLLNVTAMFFSTLHSFIKREFAE